MKSSVACCWTMAVIVGGVGCGKSPQPRLACKLVQFGEGYVPLPFAVSVTNNGSAAGRVDAVAAKDLSVTPLAATGLTVQPADQFKYKVYLFGHERAGADAKPLPAGTAMALPPGKTTDTWCALEWTLPEDAPPMLMACRASFVLSYHDEPQVETPPMVFVLQSRAGIVEAMTAQPVDDAKAAADVVAVLSSMEGEPSDGVRKLMEHMQAATR